jgi:hypothetical protein
MKRRPRVEVDAVSRMGGEVVVVGLVVFVVSVLLSFVAALREAEFVG